MSIFCKRNRMEILLRQRFEIDCYQTNKKKIFDKNSMILQLSTEKKGRNKLEVCPKKDSIEVMHYTKSICFL